MSNVVAFKCDGCGTLLQPKDNSLDYGPPAGWLQLCILKDQWCWDEDQEWHFCEEACLRVWTKSRSDW